MDRTPRRQQAFNAIDTVALRKESVDRNALDGIVQAQLGEVALRKESVDRNACRRAGNTKATSRSPQGERG